MVTLTKPREGVNPHAMSIAPRLLCLGALFAAAALTNLEIGYAVLPLSEWALSQEKVLAPCRKAQSPNVVAVKIGGNGLQLRWPRVAYTRKSTYVESSAMGAASNR